MLKPYQWLTNNKKICRIYTCKSLSRVYFRCCIYSYSCYYSHNWNISIFIYEISLLNYVPHVPLCPTYLAFYGLCFSFLTWFRCFKPNMLICILCFVAFISCISWTFVVWVIWVWYHCTMPFLKRDAIIMVFCISGISLVDLLTSLL